MIGLTDLAGAPVERVRSSAYGVGRHTDAGWAAQKGDWNFDGQVGFEDMHGVLAAFSQQMLGAGPYDPDADFDADGLVGFTDFNKVLQFLGQSKARLAEGKISMQTVANTVGYAGYLYDPDVDMYLARRRWYDAGLGRWLTSDPLGPIDGLNAYQYVQSEPIGTVDFSGFAGYVIGSDPFVPDRDDGSGPWRTRLPTANDRAMFKRVALAVEAVAASAWQLGLGNSVRHWRHFLQGTGADLTVDIDQFIDDTYAGKRAANEELSLAVEFADTLPDGFHHITSREATTDRVDPDDNLDWFGSIGGFAMAGRGTVLVCGETITMRFTLDFHDRFNWDTGKSVFGGLIEDTDFQPLVHSGLAREYNEYGSRTLTYTWKRGHGNGSRPTGSAPGEGRDRVRRGVGGGRRPLR